MSQAKQAIGGPLLIGGRRLPLSKAVRAGDFAVPTGQVALRDGPVPAREAAR